jgi:hypothetical protein
MFYRASAAVRMSRYPFLLYRQGPVPCIRPAGIAACSPASGLLRRPYPLACRSPLAGDVPATRQGSSFALSGMFHCIRAAVRMSRYPFLLYRQGTVPCIRPAGIAACSPASGLLRRAYTLACRSPLAGDVPATRQGSSFALSGMFYRASSDSDSDPDTDEASPVRSMKQSKTRNRFSINTQDISTAYALAHLRTLRLCGES